MLRRGCNFRVDRASVRDVAGPEPGTDPRLVLWFGSVHRVGDVADGSGDLHDSLKGIRYDTVRRRLDGGGHRSRLGAPRLRPVIGDPRCGRAWLLPWRPPPSQEPRHHTYLGPGPSPRAPPNGVPLTALPMAAGTRLRSGVYGLTRTARPHVQRRAVGRTAKEEGRARWRHRRAANERNGASPTNRQGQPA